MNIIRQLLIIFTAAFALNFVWEHWHSVFYLHYQGQEITNLILARAALFDAIFITALALPFIFISFFRRRLWLAPLIAVLFAVGLEIFALKTGRWAYTDAMPLVPIINLGLTPIIQLGLLAFVSYKLGFGRPVKFFNF